MDASQGRGDLDWQPFVHSLQHLNHVCVEAISSIASEPREYLNDRVSIALETLRTLFQNCPYHDHPARNAILQVEQHFREIGYRLQGNALQNNQESQSLPRLQSGCPGQPKILINPEQVSSKSRLTSDLI